MRKYLALVELKGRRLVVPRANEVIEHEVN